MSKQTRALIDSVANIIPQLNEPATIIKEVINIATQPSVAVDSNIIHYTIDISHIAGVFAIILMGLSIMLLSDALYRLFSKKIGNTDNLLSKYAKTIQLVGFYLSVLPFILIYIWLFSFKFNVNLLERDFFGIRHFWILIFLFLSASISLLLFSLDYSLNPITNKKTRESEKSFFSIIFVILPAFLFIAFLKAYFTPYLGVIMSFMILLMLVDPSIAFIKLTYKDTRVQPSSSQLPSAAKETPITII